VRSQNYEMSRASRLTRSHNRARSRDEPVGPKGTCLGTNVTVPGSNYEQPTTRVGRSREQNIAAQHGIYVG
jgi:hypothetical protein